VLQQVKRIADWRGRRRNSVEGKGIVGNGRMAVDRDGGRVQRKDNRKVEK
jgi:hypothetical protein